MQTKTNELFMQSLKNAYGSKNNFEKELVYKAHQYGNKGHLFFGINRLLNFSMYTNSNHDNQPNSNYPLLECNLDICDIANFVEDIDYGKLEKAYMHVRSLVES